MEEKAQGQCNFELKDNIKISQVEFSCNNTRDVLVLLCLTTPGSYLLAGIENVGTRMQPPCYFA